MGAEVHLRRRATLAMVFACFVTVAAQVPAVITDVRAALKSSDFTTAANILSAYRTAKGVTPEYLEAYSWMGRAALGAKQLEAADKYARETYQMAAALLKTRALDQEPRLPIALGAAIEVLGQIDVARGARTEAVAYLQGELRTYKGTSIEKRIQKNINLASLEGQPAPALDLSEFLGSKPPALTALKGKVVLMFFWAHWCSDCKQQGPILGELLRKYRDEGLVVVAPTQRFGYVAGGRNAPADEETRYIEQVLHQFYPDLVAQPIPVSAANHLRYGVSSTPTLVLLDRRGIVRMYNPGRLPLDQLEPRVRALLGDSSR
jgi:thiol-disulfide isomerase/thioredoxin